MDILLHPKTKSYIGKIIETPPQSLLIIGPQGSGKGHLLEYIARSITNNTNYNIIRIVTINDAKSIGIDQIRELKVLLSTKTKEPRIVIITDAGNLSVESQNSLLKILEEPPANTHYLLSVNNPNQVLPTIISRVTKYRLILPTESQIRDYYSSIDKQLVDKSIAIAGNRIGLINSILTNAEDPLLDAIETSKQILTSSKFERLARLEEFAKDKAKTALLFEALILMTEAALHRSSANNSSSISTWHKKLKVVNESYALLESNISPKLILSRLMVML